MGGGSWRRRGPWHACRSAARPPGDDGRLGLGSFGGGLGERVREGLEGEGGKKKSANAKGLEPSIF